MSNANLMWHRGIFLTIYTYVCVWSQHSYYLQIHNIHNIFAHFVNKSVYAICAVLKSKHPTFSTFPHFENVCAAFGVLYLLHYHFCYIATTFSTFPRPKCKSDKVNIRKQRQHSQHSEKEYDAECWVRPKSARMLWMLRMIKYQAPRWYKYMQKFPIFPFHFGETFFCWNLKLCAQIGTKIRFAFQTGLIRAFTLN